MKAKKAGLSFLGGLLMTLFLVIAVPIIVDSYVQRYITDVVGDTTFLTLSSDVIVNLLVWAIVIGFVVLLGAGGILKRFGIFTLAPAWMPVNAATETSRKLDRFIQLLLFC